MSLTTNGSNTVTHVIVRGFNGLEGAINAPIEVGRHRGRLNRKEGYFYWLRTDRINDLHKVITRKETRQSKWLYTH